MNVKIFAEAMSEIDDKYVDEVISYRRTSKKHEWIKWASMAACVCIIIVATFVIRHLIDIDNTAQVYTLSQAEQMDVKIIEWQDEGFKAIVIDTGNNSIFPINAELTVFFEEDTTIILSDGTLLEYNPDEPQAWSAGWATGETVRVEFLNYEQYLEGNGFYNRVYACLVE